MDLSHVHFEGRPTLRRRPAAGLPSVAPRPGRDPRHVGAAADPDVGAFPALVLTEAGLDPAAYRPRPLDRRVAACLRALHAESEAEACDRIAARPELHGIALNSLLIGVSAFFRDAEVFDALRTLVVPALAARSGPIRVWSVGCSTGEELYSVAILLAEADLLHRAVLLGSDCRPEAVTRARAGVFTDDALASVDRDLQVEYFEPTRGGWRISEGLRARTAWRVADGTGEIPPGAWDLVLCRNVLIYLQPSAGESMVRRITAALAPGGFLTLGKAERPAASLPLSTVTRCVYRSHGQP